MRRRSPTATTKRVLDRLHAAYGPRQWRCWGSGVSVLVDTILSQNTSARNSDSGYRQLRRRFKTWKQVARAPVEEVEGCIRVCGLSRLKAPRIQQILRQIEAERGKIDLQFLREMEDRAAQEYLMSFRGVGPKTAHCTLLFAFGKCVFPVDTHIHRIGLRLGLIPPRTSAEAAHERMLPMIPPDGRYEAHLLLIEHGRKVRKAQRPRCDRCVLAGLCDHGRRLRKIDAETR